MIERLKDGLPTPAVALLLTLTVTGCVEDLLNVGTVVEEETIGIQAIQTDDTLPTGQPECSFIKSRPDPQNPGKPVYPANVWMGVGSDHVAPSEIIPFVPRVQIGTVDRDWKNALPGHKPNPLWDPEMEEEDSTFPNVARAECDMKKTGAIAWVVVVPTLHQDLGIPHPQWDYVKVYRSQNLDESPALKYAWFFTWWPHWIASPDSIIPSGEHPPYGPIGGDLFLFAGNQAGKDSMVCDELGRCSCSGGVCWYQDIFPFNVDNDSTGVNSYATYSIAGCSEEPGRPGQPGQLTCFDPYQTQGPP